MTALRWKLAKWLVGPFVNLPERNGVWVVTRVVDGPNEAVTVHEADRFRLKTGIDLAHPKVFGDIEAIERFGRGRRWGRFVGTVKYG